MDKRRGRDLGLGTACGPRNASSPRTVTHSLARPFILHIGDAGKEEIRSMMLTLVIFGVMDILFRWGTEYVYHRELHFLMATLGAMQMLTLHWLPAGRSAEFTLWILQQRLAQELTICKM